MSNTKEQHKKAMQRGTQGTTQRKQSPEQHKESMQNNSY
jgi:hypothetical protein